MGCSSCLPGLIQCHRPKVVVANKTCKWRRVSTINHLVVMLWIWLLWPVLRHRVFTGFNKPNAGGTLQGIAVRLQTDWLREPQQYGLNKLKSATVDGSHWSEAIKLMPLSPIPANQPPHSTVRRPLLVWRQSLRLPQKVRSFAVPG